ncbi:MAG: cache domain-containing protein [Sulfurifustaceae bacterium]
MRALWLSVVALVMLVTTAAARGDDDCSNASPAEARALAYKAAAHLEKLGARAAFKKFMDPDGDYFPRDLYVFVVDLEGTMVVNGAFPQSIGASVLNAEDAKGRHYIRQMLHIATQRGEGRIEYLWYNPCTGEYTNKTTFFKRVGEYVVAVGAYGSITTKLAPATHAYRASGTAGS